MEIIPQLIKGYSGVLYAICAIAGAYFVFTGVASLHELRRAIFRLERNAVLSRAINSLLKAVLCLVGGGAIFVVSALAPAQSKGNLLDTATGTPAGIAFPSTSMPTAVITDGQVLVVQAAFTPTIVYMDAAGTATVAPVAPQATAAPPAGVSDSTPTLLFPPTEKPFPTAASETPTTAPTATPLRAIAADCARPDAQITSPAAGQVVAGIIPVRGTAVVEAGGWYKLEILMPGAVQWSFLGRGDATVQGGVLLDNFNTGNFASGVYPFRLMIIGADANVKAVCSIPLSIGK